MKQDRNVTFEPKEPEPMKIVDIEQNGSDSDEFYLFVLLDDLPDESKQPAKEKFSKTFDKSSKVAQLFVEFQYS